MITVSATKISLLCEQLLQENREKERILERNPNDVDWYLVQRADERIDIIRQVIGLLFGGTCNFYNGEVWIHKNRDFITIYKEDEA